MKYKFELQWTISTLVIAALIKHCGGGIQGIRQLIFNQTGIAVVFPERLKPTPASSQKDVVIEVKANGWCLNKTSNLEDCCKGYEKRPVLGSTHCVPICNPKCTNGFCVAPNKCECFPDHVRNLLGQCVQTCPIGCLNGKCNYAGFCSCHEGYQLHSSRKYCVPICDSQSCQGRHRNCTIPGRCKCTKGYMEDITKTCVPKCSSPCGLGRGKCIAPDVCQCLPGYTFRNDTCQAECKGTCEDGYCAKNNVCGCYHGYDLRGDKCYPICVNCDPGTCIAPGKCECDEDYKWVDEMCVYKKHVECVKKECKINEADKHLYQRQKLI